VEACGVVKDFVGVFDSGVGGISVLKELVRTLPNENFVFFGDSAHAPYGEKTDEEVRLLANAIVSHMITRGAKAIVIACNTATSAAAASLRQRYALPIVGVEPALKPACAALPGGRVLVMATPMTLRLDKFQHLEESCESTAQVICAPCPGLAARIECGNLDAPDLHDLLVNLIGPFRGKVNGVVLGCTHYPFVRKQIRAVVGDVPLFDGAVGTARQLQRLLGAHGLLRSGSGHGSVQLASSIDTAEELALYRRFYGAEL
jgi:glutamate racemase